MEGWEGGGRGPTARNASEVDTGIYTLHRCVLSNPFTELVDALLEILLISITDHIHIREKQLAKLGSLHQPDVCPGI